MVLHPACGCEIVLKMGNDGNVLFDKYDHKCPKCDDNKLSTAEFVCTLYIAQRQPEWDEEK